MSRDGQLDLQPMPRYMVIFTAIVALNVALVGWSVLQKHLFASPQTEYLATSTTDESTIDESSTDLPASDKVFSDQKSDNRTSSDAAFEAGPTESASDLARPLTAQEQLERLQPPEIVSDAVVTAQDDPLFEEIRKQAANHFPELNSSWDFSSSVDHAKPAPQDLGHRNSSPTPTELAVIQTKLESLQGLNRAALRLIHLAGQQRMLGQEEQAQRSIQQCRQIQTLMLDLLQH